MSKYTKNELIKKLKRSLIDIEAWSGPNAGDDVWEAIDIAKDTLTLLEEISDD